MNIAFHRRFLLSSVVGITFLSTACTTVETSSRISTKLTAVQFNHVASAYLERETSAELWKASNGATMLHITFAKYGQGRGGAIFVKGNSAQYSGQLEKFFEWVRLADERNEMLTKEIGRSPTWVPGGSGNLRFTFHSASVGNHVLQMTTCTVICIEETAVTVNTIGARELQRLLLDLDAGKLQGVDATIYR